VGRLCSPLRKERTPNRSPKKELPRWVIEAVPNNQYDLTCAEPYGLVGAGGFGVVAGGGVAGFGVVAGGLVAGAVAPFAG
jgi:hypothetical protein